MLRQLSGFESRHLSLKKKKKMGGISNGVANTAIDLSPTYVNYIVTAHFLVVLLWEKFEILEHNLSHILGIREEGD